MTHYLKSKYYSEQDESYHTVYIERNTTSDSASFYDEDFNLIFSTTDNDTLIDRINEGVNSDKWREWDDVTFEEYKKLNKQ